MALLNLRGPTPAAPLSIASFITWAFLAALAVSSLLGIAQNGLQLLGGWGVENFLGWVRSHTIDVVREFWTQAVVFRVGDFSFHLSAVADAYFAIDSMAFIAAYVALLLGIGTWLWREFDLDGAPTQGKLHFRILASPLLLLSLVDFVENFGGMTRMGSYILAVIATPLGLVTLGYVLLAWWKFFLGAAERTILQGQFGLSGILSNLFLALLVLGVGFVASSAGQRLEAISGSVDPWLRISAYAHVAKLALVSGVSIVTLALLILWIFGFQINGQAARATARSRFRTGAWRLVLRSRYVLAALVTFASLLLVLDQGRDLLVGLAAAFNTSRSWIVGVFTLTATAFAAWAFVFSCWLWSRLAVSISSIQSPNYGAAQGQLDAFAKNWARGLGVAALLILVTLSGKCFHDAVADSALSAATENIVAPVVVVVFALSCLVGGGLFLFGRASVSSNQVGYFNDQNNIFATFNAVRDALMGSQADPVLRNRFSWLGMGPLTLPCFALAMAIALRASSLWFIDPTDSTSVPIAMAVLLLSLTWWLGVFGWLSLSEIHSARPWVMFLIATAAVLGLAGLTDNHVVPLLADAAAPSQFWFTIGLAVLVMVALQLLVRLDAGAANAAGGLPGWIRNAAVTHPHAVVVLALFITAQLTVLGADATQTSAGSPATAEATIQDSRPSMQSAIEQWTSSMCAGKAIDEQCDRGYLVAAEGGGIRAGYWTALTLANLSAQLPDFPERTFAISGISGGSVGSAVFTACLRSNPYKESTRVPRANAGLDACIARLGTSDLLTPAIGAFLFEDLLARVVPTRFCKHSGCGFLTRGLWFEQRLGFVDSRLTEQFVALRGEGSAGTPQWLPHLLLNSTLVETGEPAIASTMDVYAQLPSARDQLLLLGQMKVGPDLTRAIGNVSAATAAHNSARFPFFNGLGAIRCQQKDCSQFGTQPVRQGASRGHLADGGFFDGGGTATVADLLAAIRDKGATANRLPIRVIYIRNDQPLSTSCEPEDMGEPKDACLLPQLKPTQYSPVPPGHEASANNLRLFVDALGPLVTLVNVSGIGSNGRHHAGSLFRDSSLETQGRSPPLLLDQNNTGALVPLGWYLSPLAKAALDQQSRARVQYIQEQIPVSAAATPAAAK